MIRLTRRQEECLGFIAAYTDREGRPPQQDEIAEHLGASSRGFVFRLVRSLEAKGLLRIRMYERRGIELAASPATEAA